VPQADRPSLRVLQGRGQEGARLGDRAPVGYDESAVRSGLLLAVISAIGWRRFLELRWPRKRYAAEPIPDHLIADLGIAPLVTKNLDAIAGMGVVQKRNGNRARGRERLRRVRRRLTRSERRYLRLASSGHGVSETAALVGRSRTHVTRALASARLILDAETVPQAVAVALRDRHIQVRPLRKRRIVLRKHEQKILRALASGLTYSQIERTLWYARGSPKSELGRAIRRNGARNRTHLLALAIRTRALNATSAA
jgi:DNA-binding CsgD family transcriptional regulator